MRTRQFHWTVRATSWITAITMTGMALLSAPAEAQQIKERREALKPQPVSELKQGQTQSLTLAQWKAIHEKKTQEAKQPEIRPLTTAEKQTLRGRGTLRNKYFTGTLPWHRSFHDVDMNTGNLFKSFTDIQVAPAQGAGLALQRTYNSMDDRSGPFGTGWTHAYDIRMEEAQNNDTDPSILPNSTQTPPSDEYTDANFSARTDFFGHPHRYHRDADGLYTPPPYLYDRLDSNYKNTAFDATIAVQDDTQTSMDGTVKHFHAVGNARVCDSLTDRYGNITTLIYDETQTMANGQPIALLKQVKDPSHRTLKFHWRDFNPTPAQGQDHIWRIVQVDGPQYSVVYTYYPGSADSASQYNLQSVILDAATPATNASDGVSSVVSGPEGAGVHHPRTTTFTYAMVSDGGNILETGLLSSITDPLGQGEAGHTVSYQYGTVTNSGVQMIDGTLSPYIGVTLVTEPGTDPTHPQYWLFNGFAVWLEDNTTLAYNIQGPFLSYQGLNVVAGRDIYWRVIDVLPNAPELLTYNIYYDSQNNVYQKDVKDSLEAPRTTEAPVIYHEVQEATYGSHGNVTEQHQIGFEASAITTGYYNGDRYFSKKSVTDAKNRTTTFGIGNTDGGDSTNFALPHNTGNKGNVLWTRDAGFGIANTNGTNPSSGKQFTYTYDSAGRKATETNLNGVVTSFTYGGTTDATITDADTQAQSKAGYLTQTVQDPHLSANDSHLGRVTTLTYDAVGHVTQTVDPAGNVKSFAYNNFGQPLTATFTKAGANTPEETITYNYTDPTTGKSNGRLYTVTQQHGTTTYTTTCSYQTGSDRVSSVNDSQTGTTSYTYGLSGERLSMTLPGGGTWHYFYADEQRGAALPQDDPGSLCRRLYYIVDDQGRAVDYGFSLRNRLCAVRFNQTFQTASDPTTALVSYCETDYTYQTTGGIGSNIRYWLQNVQTYKYDVSSNTSTLLASNDYQYDLVGNRTKNTLTSLNASGQAVSRSEVYAYDLLDRLSSVDYGDGETQAYLFDAMGNRLTKTDTLSGTTHTQVSGYNAANMLTSHTLDGGASDYSSASNDANGNTVSGGGRAMTWDSQNQLTHCNYGTYSTDFTYNPAGMRRTKTVQNGTAAAVTTSFVYVGDMLVREQQGGQNTATYFVGATGPVYRRDDTQLDAAGHGIVRWYVYDGLGSVLGEVNASGSIVDSSGNATGLRSYDVYGKMRSGTVGTSGQKFVGSLGHTTDEETGGLVYMRARYMDATTGRFVSEDPKQDGVNWFVYCENNPTNSVDQNGKNPLLIGALVAAIIGFIAGFLASAGSDYLNGNDINWGNAFYQGGIWGGAALLTTIGLGALALPAAELALLGTSMLNIGVGVAVAAHFIVLFALLASTDTDPIALNGNDNSQVLP